MSVIEVSLFDEVCLFPCYVKHKRNKTEGKHNIITSEKAETPRNVLVDLLPIRRVVTCFVEVKVTVDVVTSSAKMATVRF